MVITGEALSFNEPTPDEEWHLQTRPQPQLSQGACLNSNQILSQQRENTQLFSHGIADQQRPSISRRDLSMILAVQTPRSQGMPTCTADAFRSKRHNHFLTPLIILCFITYIR
jgi:hypothetical protein